MIGLNVDAQELELQTTIEGDFDLMMTDNIGRIYLASESELFLYTKEGKLLYRYSDLSRGQISHLDTRNPLKLLLFYPDYARITFLDNTLSPTRTEPLDLNNLELQLAQLSCTSFDNGFWVYDPVSFRLLRFNQSVKVTNEVANINQLVGAEINPNQMVEEDSWLYLNDPKYGVFVFDSFGTFSKLIPLVGAQKIQVRGDAIFLQTEEGLIKYDGVSLEQSQIDLPVDTWTELRIEKGWLYVLSEEGILIYKYVK
jgi:hypothetical protein